MEGRRGVYPPEVREVAVRLVVESREHHDWGWAAMWSVAAGLGVGTPETVRKGVRCGEVDAGVGPGVSSGRSAELRKVRAVPIPARAGSC